MEWLISRTIDVWKERGEEEPNVGVLLVTKEKPSNSDSDSNSGSDVPIREFDFLGHAD